jgi:hypothetical protein
MDMAPFGWSCVVVPPWTITAAQRCWPSRSELSISHGAARDDAALLVARRR